MITQYAIQNEGSAQKIICTPDPTNRIALLNNPTLGASEFIISSDTDNTCQFMEISRLVRNGNITRDIYGFHPDEDCFQLPNKPRLNTITFSSKTGVVDLTCNGKSNNFLISSNSVQYDWLNFIATFDNTKNVDCTFSLDNTHAAIGAFHLNVRPSTSLPGIYAGQMSDVKGMNGYPAPEVNYSGKGDADGYHNGVAIVLNPVQVS